MKQRLRRALTLAVLLGLLGVLSAAAAQAVHSYTVVLTEPSVAGLLQPKDQSADRRVRINLSQPDLRLETLARRVRLSQEPVRAAIREQGVEVLGSVEHVLNAIFILATREQAARVGRLGGVQRVVRSPRFRPLLDHAAEIVRAPAAWQALGGIENAGAGLKIGIIDTGIDRDHPAMQDPALSPPAGFPKGRPEDLAFTSNKIIVARSYVQLLNSEEADFSRPDDLSPRDRVGHGTAVATIAAGRRVNAPAAVLTGVAPKAFLGNYKIFGSPDIHDFSDASAVISAIDDAVIDGMDIISISFGAVAQFPFDEQGGACSDDPNVLCDPVALAAETAMEDFGVVVVAAAGNAGAFGEQHFPAFNSVATPGSAPAVITVGATVNSRQFVRSVRFGGETLTALSGTGPKPASPLTAGALDAAQVGDRFGCRPYPLDSFEGVIAVVERGECDFELKVAHTSESGAVAALITNVAGDDEPFVMVELETTDIPAFMIGASDGSRLRSALRTSPNMAVTLDPTLVARPFASDQLAPYSSRGPSPAGDLKPDLVAPGTFIYSAAQRFDSNGDTFSANGYASVDGTSFAAPLVAGAAALVMQRHPEFSAAEVKSALVNTAAPSILENGELARVNAVGAGLLDLPVALDPIATVVPATVSFGAVGGVALPLSRELTIWNTSANSETFRVIVEARDADTRAAVRVGGAAAVNLQLAGGESGTLQVSLQGSTPLAGSYEGFIHVLRDSGGVDLLIPYYYAAADGIPFNSFAIAGTGVVGTVNEPHPELLIFRAIDQFGQPLDNLGVEFDVLAGGGSVFLADPATDLFGVAAADVDMGPQVGPQDYEARAGGLSVPFFNAARAKPAIGGVVNGASFAAGRPVAAGSIVSIFGQNLNEFRGAARTLPLPVALKHVSVSFDFPEEGISVPGRLFFVSDEQVNVQVPWELAGLNFALVKVRIEDSASTTFSVDLADYAPGIFEFEFEGRRYGAVTHADGRVVTSRNPAQPGETLVIYATGVGPVDAPQVSGQPPSSTRLVRTRLRPAVRVAGRGAEVTFSGLAPNFVGLYQINFRLPPSAPSGNQQLSINSNGIDSNSVTIAIR